MTKCSALHRQSSSQDCPQHGGSQRKAVLLQQYFAAKAKQENTEAFILITLIAPRLCPSRDGILR
jgi:hypothetical protein